MVHWLAAFFTQANILGRVFTPLPYFLFEVCVHCFVKILLKDTAFKISPNCYLPEVAGDLYSSTYCNICTFHYKKVYKIHILNLESYTYYINIHFSMPSFTSLSHLNTYCLVLQNLHLNSYMLLSNSLPILMNTIMLPHNFVYFTCIRNSLISSDYSIRLGCLTM